MFNKSGSVVFIVIYHVHIKYINWFFCLVFLAFGKETKAQNSYKLNDQINNFSIETILNTLNKTEKFKNLQREITILDFFGTWCAPCLRALPNLEALQKKFPNQLAVVLISTEKEAQLNNFLAKKIDLTFPIVVDEEKIISNKFMPPAYPYTVIVNKQNKIIALTEASEINEAKIKEWLLRANERGNEVRESSDPVSIKVVETANDNRYTKLSEDLIYASKTGNETSALQLQLQQLNFDSLQIGLSNDAQKKAFWINIYNGYTQIILKTNPDKYKKRNQFFKARQINIAGKNLSLDQIEHDFLRRSKIKWSLGYFNKICPGKTAKAFSVDTLDYRLHFALNCGAKSCPPIAFYSAKQLNSQLDAATEAYLTGEAAYDEAKNIVKLLALMGWFRRDFKGKKNMRKILKKYAIIPQNKNPKIKFKKYSWDIYLDNYKK